MSNHSDYELYHYGVKGMKWGVRKDRKTGGKSGDPKENKKVSARKARYNDLRSKEMSSLEVKTKNGKTVQVTQDRNTKLDDFLSSLSRRGTETAYEDESFSFKADGKKVGEATFSKVSSDEINLVWLGINKNERGQGYGTAVFDAAVQYGRREGVKRLTLEVPGISPDARHIYEKQGFKVTKEPTAKEAKNDPVWGGLTHMELDLTKERAMHSALTEDDLLEKALDQTFPSLPPDLEAEIFGPPTVKHRAAPRVTYENDRTVMSDISDYELYHYGVKGMKWGVRKDRVSASNPSKKRKNEELSDKENAKAAKIARKTHFKNYNKAATSMNETHIDRLNKKYKGVKLIDMDGNATAKGKKYYKEYDDTFKEEYQKALKSEVLKRTKGKINLE